MPIPSRPAPVGADLHIDLRLSTPLLRTLERHADRLKRPPADILADIIETVLRDDLVVAVLDQ